jgi:hypothetical protein
VRYFEREHFYLLSCNDIELKTLLRHTYDYLVIHKHATRGSTFITVYSMHVTSFEIMINIL